MSLLPSRGPEVSTAQEGEMQVVGVDEEVEPLLDALASDTARAVLNAIYEEPGTPSQIADRLDMSIQKVSYHLDKLEDQDLIGVAGTRYSEKGQEMTVYEPPDEPLVLFVGTRERKRSLRTLVKRLLPTVGILALGSLAVQRFFGRGGGDGTPVSVTGGEGAGDFDGAGGDAATEAAADAETTPAQTATETAADGGDVAIQAESTETATPAPETATEPPTPTDAGTEAVDAGRQATEAVAESAGLSLDPGVAFFLGGVFVLAVLVGIWAVRTYA